MVIELPFKIKQLQKNKLYGIVLHNKIDFPESIQYLGKSEFLSSFKNKKLALFCSNRCPGSIILKSYNLAQEWAKENVIVVSGFHSAVEKEILKVLLDGTVNVVVCPARSLSGMQIPAYWHTPIQKGRMLLISPFEEKYRRPNAMLTWQRNLFVAALADKVLFLHATPGGKLEKLAMEIKSLNNEAYYLNDPANFKLKDFRFKIFKGVL